MGRRSNVRSKRIEKRTVEPTERIVEQRAPLFVDARPAARLVLGACSVEIRTAELRAKRLGATEDFLRPFNLAAASLSPAPSPVQAVAAACPGPREWL
jgi:hypothetical protein